MRKFASLSINLRSACQFRQYQRKAMVPEPVVGSSKYLAFSCMSREMKPRRIFYIPLGLRSQCGVVYQSVAHQIRHYAQDTGKANSCWKCNKNSLKWKHLICNECGHLQDLNAEINYFDLLDCPHTFGLQQKELTKCFRSLQAVVHPDKYSNKSAREQTNSAEWSSLINKAYKTLSVPIERGQYMLQLQGKQIPEDNSVLDKNFLMEMMERNEEVENAKTKQDIKKLQQQIQQDINAKVAELNKHFEANALDKVTATLVEMKYLHSIQSSINNKYQKMLGR